MSDARTLDDPEVVWKPDPLLTARAQVPHFLRTQWDEGTARSFGPWRVAAPLDPTSGQTASAFIAQDARTDMPVDSADSDPALALSDADTAAQEQDGAPVSGHWTDAAIAALKQEAWQQGLQQGLQQAREEFDSARQRDGEVLRHLGIELRSLQQDPQRFFEPLKRLALHIAEQWVRGELQVSGRAIEQLVRQSLAQLDPGGEKVHVELHPADLERLKALGEQATADMELQADPQLREGSVRVRLNESVVQDLIEHRLETMARKLLQQPDAWLQHSALLHPDKAAALDPPASVRSWSRQPADVQEVDIKRPPKGDEEPA